MEFRKKNLDFKKDFETQLYQTITDKKQMGFFEPYIYMKKNMQLFQKEKNIEPIKPVTITNKALTLYINEKLQKFLKYCYGEKKNDKI